MNLNPLTWFKPASEAVKTVAGVFVENKEAQGQRSHENDISARNQLSAEFHSRQNRSWFDSFVDGWNRLPRPVLVTAVLSFFVLSYTDTEKFVDICKALAIVPTGFWTILGIIITFYFGGRMQAKAADFKMTKDQAALANELIAEQKARETEKQVEKEEAKSDYSHIRNKVVREWLEKEDG